MSPDALPSAPLKLGISACLLGHKVRYDGGSKLDPFLRDTLGAFVQYVPICPEVECGMPVPREAIRLVGDPAAPRLLGQKSGHDFTEQMRSWALPRLDALEAEGVCGYIFKSKSPSSGMERIKVYDEKGLPRPVGVGVWARLVMERFPLLAFEDEGRLRDPGLRENFITRVFVYQRWRELLDQGKATAGLVDFHTRHKLLILSHNEKIYRELGRLVAEAARDPQGAYSRYHERLVNALRCKATPKRHVNTLMHAMGYFKKMIGPDQKQELLELIEHYSRGAVPLIVPVTLINHYVRLFDEPYLKQQVYLRPHPLELQLRNHV
jgi:uncharacterized protein YbgA (DUF1722 family)/uncharacterized protein YbbK (DUF523 family)